MVKTKFYPFSASSTLPVRRPKHDAKITDDSPNFANTAIRFPKLKLINTP